MRLKIGRHTKFIVLISLFCLSFFLIPDYLSQNSPNPEISQEPIPDSIPFSSGSIIYPWGNDNGTAICTEINAQLKHQIISDGLGGAIMVWRDFRAGYYTIYAQRVDADGNTLWGANGTAICLASQNKDDPKLCTDGKGGAFIAWEDWRDSNFNIYVQYINSTGNTQWTTDGVRIVSDSASQINPQVASDGQDGVYVTWEDFRAGNYDIYAQRLNATGHTLWTTDGIGVITDTNSQTGHELIADGFNNTIFVWEDDRNGNSDVYAQKLDLNGNDVWTTDGVAVCDYSFNQFYDKLAPDGAGGAIFVWNDYRASNYDIYAQRINSAGLEVWTADGVAICSVTNDQMIPQITADGSGGAIISWEDHRGLDTDIYTQRVDANGVTQWTPQGLVVCNTTGVQDESVIVNVDNGSTIIAWTDTRAGTDDIYAQYVTSAGTPLWAANGSAVCTALGNQYTSQITSNNAKSAIIIWRDARSDTGDIYSQRIFDGDIEGPSTPIVSSPTHPVEGTTYYWPDITLEWSESTDATGVYNYIYMYDQISDTIPTLGNSTTFINSTSFTGIADGTWYFHVRANDTLGNLGDTAHFQFIIDAWPADGVPVYTDFLEEQDHPQITPDGAGGAIISWHANTGDSYIWAQRIAASGQYMWEPNGTIICDIWPSRSKGPTVLCSDGAGGAIVVWADYRNLNYDIYAQRINSTGQVQWTTNGIAICDATGGQEWPEIASDGAGGAYIVWEDNRGGNYDIYAQHINSSGDPQWTANGIVICNASGLQNRAELILSGTSGTIITWEDLRDGGEDIYAQRIEAGTPMWGLNGIPICTVANNQRLPLIVPDGEDGGIIMWEDERADGGDIYAQRVNVSGVTQWAPNGTVICVESGDQSQPRIASDESGGATIVWADNRVNWDIYAQKINSSGQVQWVANGVIICNYDDSQTGPGIASDGVGGAIIAWSDWRSMFDADIYAQHVNAIGQSLLAANGTLICGAAESQYFPQCQSMEAVAPYHAIMVWNDMRNSMQTDIYAQRVIGVDQEGPAAPILSSPTHPDENFVYSSPHPAFEWTAYDPSGITNYLYMWDKNPLWVPTELDYVTTDTSVNLSDLPDGIWYFHVRANDTLGNLGATAHLKFSIDSSFNINFSPFTLEASNNQTRATVLADFDQDGDLDIATSDNSSTYAPIYILWNPFDEGSGIDPFKNISSWSKTIVGAVTGYVQDLEVGDLNNDGTLDLVSSDDGVPVAGIKIWKNNGTPSLPIWEMHTVYTQLFQTFPEIELGDTNNDGDLDIVFAEVPNDLIYGADNPYSQGYNPFNTSWNYESIGGSLEIYDLKLADLDRNGFLDAIYAAEFGRIFIIEHNASGWTEIGYVIDNSVVIRSLEIVDLDHNGTWDLVAGTENSEILVFSHDGNPFSSGWSKTVVGQSNLSGSIPLALTIGDLDNNGYADIITAFSTAQDTYIQIYKNNKRPFLDDWATVTQGVYEATCFKIALGDLDHDGDLDATFGCCNVYLARNDYERLNPIPVFSDRIQLFSSSYLLRVEFGDLDNDGDLDVVGRFNNDPVVYGWRNNGDPFGTWTQFTIKSIGGSGNFFSAKLVDLDNDGWLDIAAGYGVQAHVLRNDHTPWNGQWDNYQFAASTFYGYNEIGVTDFDHDGNVDIACTSTMNGLGVFIWKNNGTPFRANWDQYKIGSSIGGVEMRYLRVADFDNDGWDDLVSADYGGYVYFWRNNHTPFISNWPTYVTQSIGGTNRLCTADLDFDGDPDVCAYSTDATINTKVLECDETPFSGSWNYNTLFSSADTSYNGITSGDVDGDGWSDVIMADSLFIGGGNNRLEPRILINNHTPFHNSWDNYILQCSTLNLFAQDIHLQDIDWDGDLDILIATTGSGGAGLYCWKNLADQDFSGPSAPVINSSTHPNPISWYNSLNVTMQWTAHDPSGIINYLYCYDQNSSTIPTPADQITSYTSSNITIPFDGVWYFHVRGNDTFGNLGDTGHFIVQLDITPPQAFNPRPLNGGYTNDPLPSVYLDINDTLSGVGMVFLFVNGTPMSSNWNGTTVSWIGSGYPSETLFNIQVDAIDVAGNSMTPYQWSFYIDLTPPVVTEILPENNSYTSNSMPNIIAYLDDVMIGLNTSSVEMRLNNSLVNSNITTIILTSLGPLEMVSPAAEPSHSPEIAIDSLGNIHVVWHNAATPNNILYRCWNATTHNWTPIENITIDSADHANRPAITVDADGNVHVAWEDDSDGWWGTETTIFYKYRNRTTGTWSGFINTTDVIAPGNYSQYCDIDVDPAGQPHIVWYDQTWTAIYYRFWNASLGSWTPIEDVSYESTAVSMEPKIAIDSNGTPHVVWYDSTGLGEVDASAYDIFYKYRNMTAGFWTSVEVISLGSSQGARYPDIAIDPEDHVHVVWRDQRVEAGGQIYYRRRNATTETWASMTVVCPFSGQSTYPRVAANEGFVHIVWQDSADYAGAGSSDYDIFYRVQNKENDVWSDIQVVSTESNETDTQCWYASLAVDNTGTPHILWEDTLDYLGSGSDSNIFYKNLTINNLWEVTYTPPTPYPVSNTVQVDIDAADLLGNVMSTYSWIFTIDLDPPIASNPYPSHESCIIDADPLISLNLEDSWSGINNATISLIVNGSLEVYSWNGTTLSWDSAGPYASGTLLNLAVNVQDIAGNVMPTYSWWFIIDYDPPTASNPTPGNNNYTSDGTPDITVILDDPGSGLDLDTIEMRINTSLITSILSPIVGPLGELQVVSNDSTQSYYPEIAVDSSGNLHVVWYDNAGGWDNIFYRCWNATTGSWTTTEQTTTQTNGNARNPKVAVDPDGNVHVVYEDDTDGWWGTYWNIFYKLRNASTGVWSGHINTTDVISFETIYNSIYCEIAVDTFNQAHIVWYQDYNVYYKRWNASLNNWDAAELVSSGCSGTSSQPAIAVDSTGRPHVVWHDNTNLGESDSDAYDVFYRYKNIATGNWAALQYISLGSSEPAWNADIAIDSADHVHVVWKDERDDPDGYIYYRRRNATTSSWTSMEIVCSLPGISEFPKIAEGNGIVHVVWYDRSDYLGAGLNDYDIFYRGLDVARNAWSNIALISVESNVSSNSWYPAIAADNTGVAHIVWMDPTNTIGAGSDNDIFYRQVSLGSSWMVSWIPGASYPSSLILVEVEAADLLGNTMGTYSWSFIIDRDSPLASSPYPLLGSYISNDDPTILLNLLDALSGINASTIVLSVNGSPEVHSWNGTTLSWDSAGPYASGSLLNLAVEVYDNVGNAMPTYSWWFIIDLDGPQASSPNPANNSYVSSTTPTITIELVDLLSGVNSSSIILNVNSIDYRVSDPELNYIGTTLTFNPPSAYSDAQLVSLTLDSSDLLGNAMSSYIWTFIVDVSQPFLLNEQPEDGTYVAELQPNISLLLADSTSGVNSSSINLNVEGTDYNLTNIELNYISSNLTFIPPASYANGQIINCILTASDNAGNALTPYAWSFTIDIAPPQASAPHPADGMYTGNALPTISINLADSLSGINASTIVLTVEGITRSHNWNGTTVTWTAGTQFANGQVVDVEIDATDNIGNMMTTYMWSFTVDLASPFATSPGPENTTYIADDMPNIQLVLLDYLSGINISSIQMEVNGSLVSFDWQEAWISTEVVSEGMNNTSYNPSIAIDSIGNVHIVWSDLTPYNGSGNNWDILYSRWDVGLKNWTVIKVISTESSSNAFDPDIVTDQDGNLYVTWYDYTNFGWNGGDADIFYKFRNATTGIWSGHINATDVISLESDDDSLVPKIDLDPQGNVYIVWYDHSDWDGEGDTDIFFKYWNKTTQIWAGFINMTDVVSTESWDSSEYPSLGVDSLGNVHVTWHDSSDYGGAGTDRDIFYKYWNSTTRSWTGHLSATDVISTGPFSSSNRPALALDSAGVVHIVWNDMLDGWWGTGDAIFYKHWNASAGVWTGYVNNTDVVSYDCFGNSQIADILTDLNGNVHIVWGDASDWDGEGDRDIFYKYWNATDNQWILTQVISTISDQNSDNPTIAIDAKGQIHIAWDDFSDWDGEGDRDIFYQKGISAHFVNINWTPSILYSSGDIIPIEVDAQDNVGNPMPTYSWFFIVDTFGPQASNPSPPAAYISDNQPTITITLNDTLSGVNASSINLNVEGINYNISSPELSFGGVTVTFNPSVTFVDGQQIDIALDASDNVGNAMATFSWLFTIDISGPQAGNETPTTGAYEGNPFTFISVDLADALSGVNMSTIVLTVASIVRLHNWDGTTVSWTSGELFSDGQNVICQVEALDNLGNVMIPFVWNFTVDISPPQASNPAPANGGYTDSSQPIVNITLTDSLSGVNANSIVLTVEGTDYNLTDSELSYNSGILTFIPSGSFSDTDIINLTLNAYDNVGTVMTAFSWSFMVDLTPPTALNENPANNTEEYITETPQIKVTLTDWNSGINATSIVLTVNGIPVAHSFNGVNVTYTPTPLPQLVWNNITIDVSDMAGNPMPQYRWRFFINLSRPTIRDVSPINNSYVNNASPEISVFIDSPQLAIVEGTINLTVNGVQVQANYDNVTGKVWNVTAVPFTHGQLIQVYLSANDTINNTCFATWSFTIDLNDPTVIGYAPIANYINNSMPLILVNIIDDLAGINSSSIVMNITDVTVSHSWNGLTVSWSPGGSLSNGDLVNVTLNVKDNAGNPLPTFNFWFWIDTVTPSVDVLVPVSFGIYQGGIPLNITWTMNDTSPCTVTIEYSDNNGSTWQSINAGSYSQLNDGIELWTLPSIDAASCLVRINMTDSVGFIGSDSTDNTFIIWITYPSVSILSPTSSTVINAGDPFTIQWSGSNGAGARTIDIEYSANNGTLWQPLFTLPDNGSKNWITPIIDSAQCLIRINITDEALHTDSVISNLFAIDQLDPTCILDTPMTGVTITGGDLFTIRWTANDTASSVTIRIEYTLDGTHWYDINGGTYSNVNDGAESWAVPSVTTDSDQCRIRITVTDAAGHYFDITSDFFTLKAKPSQDDTLTYIIIIAVIAAAAVTASLLVIRSRRKPDVSISPERAKWISALGEIIKPEMSMQEKLKLIIDEAIPVEAIKDEKLVQLLNTSIGGIPLEIFDQLIQLPIPEDQLSQILLELQNLTVEEQIEFIKELSNLNN